MQVVVEGLHGNRVLLEVGEVVRAEEVQAYVAFLGREPLSLWIRDLLRARYHGVSTHPSESDGPLVFQNSDTLGLNLIVLNL